MTVDPCEVEELIEELERRKGGKWMDILKAASDPKHVGVKNEIAQDRLDAQRYRKLKAYSDECKDWQWSDLWEQPNLDSAVDALPDPNENPNGSR